MKGFKNTTRMVSGHGFATGGTINRVATGGTINAMKHGGHHHFAEGGHIGGLDEHESDMHGHALVHRSESSTEQLHEGGGKTSLNPGYAKGGKPEKHFHVHHHYHGGKVSKAKMRQMEMQGEHKATGGHIHDETSIPSGYPDYAKGGKWIKGAIKHPGALHRALHVPEGKKIPHNKIVKAEHSKNPKLAKRAHLAETLGRMHHKATGGTIDKLAAGGALYAGGGKVHEDAAQDRPMMERIAKQVVKSRC